jgi:PAS domain S-box-containing protein
MSREDDDVILAGDEALHSALASIPGVSVIVFDCALRIRALHGTALQRYGYVHEQMVGKPARETLRPPVWERVGPLVLEALAGKTTTIRQRSEDGIAVYESTFSPVRRDARVVAATMTSRDITAQMVAEGELSEAKGRLQAILDHSPMAIYMRDLEQRWIVANAETCGIMGKAAAEMLGRPMAEAFPPEA